MIVAFERDADESSSLNEEFDYERASARILGRDVAMAMIRKRAGSMADSDSAIALLVEVQKGVSETRRS